MFIIFMYYNKLNKKMSFIFNRHLLPVKYQVHYFKFTTKLKNWSLIKKLQETRFKIQKPAVFSYTIE